MQRLHSRGIGSLVTILTLSTLALLTMPPGPTQAIEIPPDNSPIYIQTNGPNAAIGLGDWYTSRANGVTPTGGYHYFQIAVPSGWPRSEPLHIDLFSPEMNANNPVSDERGITPPAPLPTTFEIYGPGTALAIPTQPGDVSRPQPGEPADPAWPGSGSLLARSFPPASTPEQWVRFYTINPPADPLAPFPFGNYILRVETGNSDQNAWRLRIGLDNDGNPNNPPPANFDNPDGLPGTNDEPFISIYQTTYQHNSPTTQCLTLYQFVPSGLPEAAFHNFDLDGNVRVTYYPPSANYQPDGSNVLPAPGGGIQGSVSSNRVWNGPDGTTTSRGRGDVITNPEPGLWRIVTCVNNNNQFNQEGITGIPTSYTPPPTPVMTLAKDDGVTTALPGDVLTYVMSFANTSDATPSPGAALNVVLTDAVPANTTYLGCAIDPPGICSESGGIVTYTLGRTIAAGERGSVRMSVRVNAGATGQIANTASLSFSDSQGNAYPPISATDTNTIPLQLTPPDVDATKSAALVEDLAGNGLVNPGDVLEYTVTMTNAGQGAATGVTFTDTPDVNTTLIIGTVTTTQGAVVRGNMPGDTRVEVDIGDFFGTTSVTIRYRVRVNDPFPANVTQVVNQGLIAGNGIPDVPTDDPRTPLPDDPTRTTVQPPPPGGPPTAITLLSFTATARPDGVLLGWTTGAEQNTWGFHIYRATSGDRARAVRVTPAIISGQGRGLAGASYTWLDVSAVPGQPYTYWLQEIELGGNASEYGPATVGVPMVSDRKMLYIPILVR